MRHFRKIDIFNLINDRRGLKHVSDSYRTHFRYFIIIDKTTYKKASGFDRKAGPNNF